MSLQNFKINSGIDLNGKVLEYSSVSGIQGLRWDTELLATQTYVTDAITNSAFSAAAAAGAYLNWDAGTEQFNVDAAGLVSGASYLQYLTPAGPLDVNISALVTELTVNQGLALATDVPSSTDDLSEGINNLYFTDARAKSSAAALLTDTSTILTNITITGDGSPTNPLVITAENGVADSTTDDLTEGTNNLYYTDSRVNTVISNSLGIGGDIATAISAAAYTDADAVDAIAASLGTGLTVEQGPALETYIAVDTTVIATKAYADSIAQGLDIKASVKVASTTDYDFTATPGGIFVDGINITDGSRVLLKNQTNTAENGIYVWESGQLVRASDATLDAGANIGTLTKGAFTFVESGTNAGKGFVVSALDYSPGTSITWTQFSETGNYITAIDTLGPLAVVNGTLSLGIDSDALAVAVLSGSPALTTNKTKTVLVDATDTARSTKKVFYSAAAGGGSSTAIQFDGVTDIIDVTLKVGNRISKISAVGDSWTEYAIVDGNASPASISLAYSAAIQKFTISDDYSVGDMTVIVEFVG